MRDAPVRDAIIEKYLDQVMAHASLARRDQARAMLLAHGYTYKDGQIYNKSGAKVTIEFNSANGALANGPAYAVQQWRAIGLDIKWDSRDSQTFASNTTSGNFDMSTGGTPDIGDLTLGVALSYLDFRYADLKWREAAPRLARAYETLAARPSLRETQPYVEKT